MESYTKKALGVGQVFIFILAGITFALILIFGYRVINEFLEKGETAEFFQFKNDLESSIKKIYPEYGSVREEQFRLPSKFTQICFVDLDAEVNDKLCEENVYACEVWRDAKTSAKAGGGYDAADENVFLTPLAPIKMKVYRISMLSDGFLCVPVRQGTFTLVLEGKGDRTEISS
ncbi:hypothetical protein HYX14_01740 [Candidatus Woesearchaeota archaeon]|nr:hypothetical protein [Candidatus Woesearchaeota archaeon]